MALRKIIRMGHPVLRQRSRELTKEEIVSPQIAELIADMIETMHQSEGVGIAAPQVGELLRLAIIEFEPDNERYPEMGAQGLTVFINPVMTYLTKEEQGFWEGCLSVPDLRGLVHRPTRVQVDYLDAKAQPQQIIGEGFLATVLQHEFDHLDGVLYVDRVRDPRNLAFIEEFQQFIAAESEHEELDDE